MSDDIERRLRAARPDTAADDGWADSPAGDAALARIRSGVRPARRRIRPGVVITGLAAAAAVVVSVAVATSGSPGGTPSQGGRSALPTTGLAQFGGPRPATVALASYDSCGAALAGLRKAAAAHRSAYVARSYGFRTGVALGSPATPVPGAAAKDSAAPAHSDTNNQEAGVDEPDVVKTDGRRIVSVTGGVLRVVDVESRRVTGTLDLSIYAGAAGATLYLSGDRVLVLLAQRADFAFATDTAYAAPDSAAGFVLVDIAKRQPRIVSTLRPHGGFVDARMVDGVVRAVVHSTPTLAATPGEKDAAWRARVARAPLSAWLPSWTVTTGDRTTEQWQPCEDLSHPARFTGADLLTVFTIDMAAGLDDVAPVTVTATGATVYGSGRSLYVADADYRRTTIHRFDLRGTRPPAYLGSATVPGSVQNSYSLSEYDGTLRVVTTAYRARTVSSVYLLAADTLRVRGHLDGLGRDEQVYGVRFAGPLAYLVTYRQIDPLHVLDLSDPAKPRTTGTLKITGYSAYLHDLGGGRLLGVGAQATPQGRITGAQVSLFDVADPARPSRTATVERVHSYSDVADPHTFLWWPATRTAFVPMRNQYSDATRILAVRVDGRSLTVLGSVAADADGAASGGVLRALVVGDEVWTLSADGLRVNLLSTLAPAASVPFSR